MSTLLPVHFAASCPRTIEVVFIRETCGLLPRSFALEKLREPYIRKGAAGSETGMSVSHHEMRDGTYAAQ
jgi:hypothetical protein